MRRIVLSSVFVLMSGVVFAQDLTAPGQITKPLYQWRTESEKQEDGAFKHCLVKNMYDNGTVMMLAENYDGVKRIALQFPKAKLTMGEHADLTLQVDRRDVFPAEAVAVSPQILTIGIPDALPDQFRKGEALYVRGPNDEVIYRLDGAEGAVLALQDCITSNKNASVKLAEKTDDAEFEAKERAEKAAQVRQEILAKQEPKKEEPKPVVTAAKEIPKPVIKEEPKEIVVAQALPKALPMPTPAPVPAPAPAPVVKSIPVPAPPVAAQLPTPTPAPAPQPLPKPEPKVAPTPVVKPAPVVKWANPVKAVEPKREEPKVQIEKPKNLLPDPMHGVVTAAGLQPTALLGKSAALDYVWKKDNLFVGIKYIAPTTDFQTDATNYMKSLRSTCTGPFIAEASLPVRNAVKRTTWMVAEAACAANGKDKISALLFIDQGKGAFAYVVEAPAANGAAAIQARDRLIAAILK